MVKKVLVFMLAAVCLQMAQAADLARETRMADEIVDAIIDGDPEMLTVDGHEFLSIYTEAEEAKGAIIIMHGRGFHPNWVDVVQPLRVGLVDMGWNTLSIQMPVLEKEAKFYDYLPIMDEATPRIEAAIDFLKKAGNDKIILIAHSCSAHMSMQYVRNKGDAAFDAFVGIGMGAVDYKQPMLKPFPLDKMSKPMLDIYGGDDFPAVHRLAPERLRMIKAAGHHASKQLKIAEANHYFTDKSEALVEAVGDWLEQFK